MNVCLMLINLNSVNTYLFFFLMQCHVIFNGFIFQLHATWGNQQLFTLKHIFFPSLIKIIQHTTLVFRITKVFLSINVLNTLASCLSTTLFCNRLNADHFRFKGSLFASPQPTCFILFDMMWDATWRWERFPVVSTCSHNSTRRPLKWKEMWKVIHLMVLLPPYLIPEGKHVSSLIACDAMSLRCYGTNRRRRAGCDLWLIVTHVVIRTVCVVYGCQSLHREERSQIVYIVITSSNVTLKILFLFISFAGVLTPVTEQHTTITNFPPFCAFCFSSPPPSDYRVIWITLLQTFPADSNKNVVLCSSLLDRLQQPEGYQQVAWL